MNSIKLTIITLTYNNWRLLPRAIESLSNQCLLDNSGIEYLVVDDGTSDFDSEYVGGLLTKLPFNSRIILNSNNVGTVESFNRALKHANGEIIIPLSADDELYDSNVLSDILNVFSDEKVYLATGLRVAVVNGKEIESFPLAKDRALFYDKNALLKKLLCDGNIISGASTYYRKGIFDIIGDFDNRYKLLEDYPFYIKALSNGFDIKLLERNVIRYGTKGVSSNVHVNPALKSDLRTLHKEILSRNDLNYSERRRGKFNNFSRLKKFMLSPLYPDQFIIKAWKKLFK